MMKKENFISLILGLIGIMFLKIGICMSLIDEWNAFNQGIIIGVMGIISLIPICKGVK